MREYITGGSEEESLMAAHSLITDSQAYYIAVISNDGDLRAAASSKSLVDHIAVRYFALHDCSEALQSLMSGEYGAGEDEDE